MKLKSNHTIGELRRTVHNQRLGATNKLIDVGDDQRELDKRRAALDAEQRALDRRWEKAKAEMDEVEKAETLLEDFN